MGLLGLDGCFLQDRGPYNGNSFLLMSSITLQKEVSLRGTLVGQLGYRSVHPRIKIY